MVFFMTLKNLIVTGLFFIRIKLIRSALCQGKEREWKRTEKGPV